MTNLYQPRLRIASSQVTDFTEASEDTTANILVNTVHGGIEATYDDAHEELNIQVNRAFALMTSASDSAIMDNAVTLAQMEHGTRGDILTYNGAGGPPTRLAKGTSTYVLTAGADDVSWTAPAPTWAQVSGKPSTFDPSAHTQAASTITDFSEAVEDATANLLTTTEHCGADFTYDDTNAQLNLTVHRAFFMMIGM